MIYLLERLSERKHLMKQIRLELKHTFANSFCLSFSRGLRALAAKEIPFPKKPFLFFLLRNKYSSLK